jgi:hypothetical protein
MYGFDEDGNLKVEKKELPKNQEELFQQMKDLKAQRRQAAMEGKQNKEQVERSAGELALMFMGINQASYELLVENPMTGYMNEMIFTRVLGREDIEQGGYWIDQTQCWVCQRWTAAKITYHPDDKAVFVQKIG